jgi:hypothetical protein
MTKETLLLALEAERLKVGADGIAIPEDRDATFIVAASGETLQIGKIVKIDLRESSFCLETSKAERYWLTYDLVLGIRVRPAQAGREHTAGFGR